MHHNKSFNILIKTVDKVGEDKEEKGREEDGTEKRRERGEGGEEEGEMRQRGREGNGERGGMGERNLHVLKFQDYYSNNLRMIPVGGNCFKFSHC